MEKHFVTFCSPGTFCPETSEKPIESWDVEVAKAMALTISERHGATPFGFYFSTRSRGEKDLDSKESACSNFYYLGGRVETRAEVEARIRLSALPRARETQPEDVDVRAEDGSGGPGQTQKGNET